ncbi:butyrate kinase [Bacillus marinisedimentorum]|uniref:butyrate kinase n=1 Tax=Bacillus marinisedimentorum TaxID=1821260 RepID=UPI0007DF1B02|nr:butyrate kinase [Bacillus marinisedimentorum]
MPKTILAINPGSTSTKFAVFEGKEMVFSETIRHRDEDIMKYPSTADQLPYRLETIVRSLHEKNFDLGWLDGVVGRGGLLKPLESGTYEVNEEMLADARSGKYGDHASNLGSIIAYELAQQVGVPAYIVDPVGVDELVEEARLSGLADIERKSHVHALNIKAVSRQVAGDLGKPLEELNFVVAHIGGGISVVAHRGGRIIDVNNADNEGPFSPERAGGLPAKQLVQLCYSGKYTEKEMLQKLTKQGGMYSYVGTKSALEVEEKALAGDEKAGLVLKAMVHQIGKEIGAMATVLEGRIDGVILTGGISYSDYLVGRIKEKVGFLGEVYVVPGEAELEALAAGAVRVLLGEESVRIY